MMNETIHTADLTEQEREFLALANNKVIRQDFLAHLARLGLLSAFLMAETFN